MKKSSFVKTDLDRITYQIIGIAMDIHNQLGSGHREEAYHNALVAKFSQRTSRSAASASPKAPMVTLESERRTRPIR